MGRSIRSRQRLDAEVARGRVEAVAQRLGHGHAVLAAIKPLAMALLAGKPDALHSRQPLGAAHGANGDIDLALELLRRCEGLDRERDNGMPGICRLARLLDEIDDVSPKRCRIESPG